jgi:transcriptional regulator with XRE-family HTH domain
MPEQPPETFGQVLTRLRTDARLTLEGLADKADLGVRTIGNLERGKATPRAATVTQLAQGLGMNSQDEAWLWAIARGKPAPRGQLPPSSLAVRYSLPQDISAFTSRMPSSMRSPPRRPAPAVR